MTEEDFDQEQFAEEVNEALRSATNSRLTNFHQYGMDTYKVSSETYSNIFEHEDIYVDVNYNEDISGEVLILTIDFDTNDSDHMLGYTVNDYDPYEVAEALNELYEDLLLHYYKEQKDYLVKFAKEDIKFLISKYPEDQLLKSLLTGAKYKLFDAFIHTDWDEEEDYDAMGDITQSVAEQISNHLDKEMIEDLVSYGNHQYMIESEFLHEHDKNDDIYIMLEDVDGQVEIIFDCNNPNRDDRITLTVDNDTKSIAKAINELTVERFIELYKEENSLAQHMPKSVLKKLLDKDPENQYLKSLYGGSKYKLFDSFLAEDYGYDSSVDYDSDDYREYDSNNQEKYAEDITEHLDRKFISDISHYGGDAYMCTIPMVADLIEEWIMFDLYKRESHPGLLIMFDVNTEILDNTPEVEVPKEKCDPKNIALILSDLAEKRVNEIYIKDKKNVIEFTEEGLEYILEKYPEDKDLIRSYKGVGKFKLFDSNLFEGYVKPELPSYSNETDKDA